MVYVCWLGCFTFHFSIGRCLPICTDARDIALLYRNALPVRDLVAYGAIIRSVTFRRYDISKDTVEGNEGLVFCRLICILVS